MSTRVASGTFTRIHIRRQTGVGGPSAASTLGGAVPTTGALTLRRVSATINKKKAFYKSAEIRASQQRSDGRHGMVSVDGSINGELSVGTYLYPIGSVLRGATAWNSPITSGAVSDVTSAVLGGALGSGTFTRLAGSWITGNLFKVGMVVRFSGFGGGATANNAHNFLITSLTTTVMTGIMLDGVPVVAIASGATAVTALQPGRQTHIPLTGHIADYYTIEREYLDVFRSEQFTDCVFGGFDIKIPASGMATIDFPLLGLNMTVAGDGSTTTGTVFGGTKLVASTGKVLSSANGAIFVQGIKVGTITSLDVSVTGNNTAPSGTVGSDVNHDIFLGVLDVSGNMSVYFDSVTMRDYFLAETEISIVAAFTASGAANAEFIAFTMPVCKVNGADKSDGETGLTMTVPFVSLENTAGGDGTSSINTSFVIQDSLCGH